MIRRATRTVTVVSAVGLSCALFERTSDPPRCYLPGERVDPDVTLEDAAGRPEGLGDLAKKRPGTRALVLSILGGAAARPGEGRKAMWCGDSFDELAGLRVLRRDFATRDVLFVGVLCPPVHDEARFGFDAGAFLGRPPGDPLYEKNRRKFVNASLELETGGGLPFDVVLFDPRLRLLGDPRRRPSPGAEGAPWHGRFKWHEDRQTYGTPTTWILTRDLEVAGRPFHLQPSGGRGARRRYTTRDMSELIERTLRSLAGEPGAPEPPGDPGSGP